MTHGFGLVKWPLLLKCHVNTDHGTDNAAGYIEMARVNWLKGLKGLGGHQLETQGVFYSSNGRKKYRNSLVFFLLPGIVIVLAAMKL